MTLPRAFRPSRITSTLASAFGAAALAVASFGSLPARAGEALEIELPSMATPVEPVAATGLDRDARDVDRGLGDGPTTRAQVRAELAEAREAGILSPHHDIGDTPEVLAAREAWYAEQVLRAQQAAADAPEAERIAALDAATVLPAAAQAEIRAMLEQAAAEGDEAVFVIVFDADDPDSVAAAEALGAQLEAEAARSGARIGPAVDVIVDERPGAGIEDV